MKKKMVSIATAFSSHKACFICGAKAVSLHQVNKRDVVHAYIQHKIYVKSHARCCDAHFGENGLIRREEFFVIPTKAKLHSVEIAKLFEMLETDFFGIFEPFKNIRYLDDEHCKKITGWSKEQFLNFSDHITSIHSNKKRNKDQLIALYRYWLRTGIDQRSLACLFGYNITQNQISNFLKQIRKAINKDFVQHYLGANKEREFFLSFNTVMTHKLHNLGKDDLVVVADGTYARIEKSANNDFQYKTYSEHKSAPLIKPFFICCADGYIIDCYGPFQANKNDSKILEFILKTDESLMKLLDPDRTLFLLDRGFRQALKDLKDTKLNFKLPTCFQDKKTERPLTINETSNTRRVTKCRFIVEKKIGDVKKNLALDNRRNTEVGHLQIDYRIACAMLNFYHKPICADRDNAEKIADRILSKCDTEESNGLEHLFPLRFDTEKNPLITLSEITDFPKLSLRKLADRLFFGSFYIKQCKSYLSDLNKSLTCSIVTNELLDTLRLTNNVRSKFSQETKIIGLEMLSRHKRSLKTEKPTKSEKVCRYVKRFRVNYKVFIQYKPDLNSYESIISYVCSCQSGLRQAGCCVHVATLIYYLSYARFRLHKIRLPAEHLNSVLVDMTKMECPNNPEYVKSKRRKIIESSSESSDSEDELKNENKNENNDDKNGYEDKDKAFNDKQESIDDKDKAFNDKQESIDDKDKAFNDKQESIDDKDKAFNDKQESIDDKDKAFNDKQESIDDKDKAFNDKQESIDDKDKAFNDKQESIDDKDKAFNDKQESIDDKDKAFNDKQESIDDKDKAFNDKQESIDDKDKAFNDKQESIDDKDKAFNDKQESIDDKDKAFNDKQESIDDKDKAFNDKQESIDDKDMQDDQKSDISIENPDENESLSAEGDENNNIISIEDFKTHIPKWGAHINYNHLKNVFVSNTCTIDYFLLALWVLNKMVPHLLDTLPPLEPTDTIKNVIKNIEKFYWNKARELWIVKIMKYNKKPIKKTVSMFGSEYEMFVKYMLIYQIYNVKQICETNCKNTNKIISKDRDTLLFKKTNDQIKLYTCYKKKCQNCNQNIVTEFQFINAPKFIFIESGPNITLDEIPQKIRINNSIFRLLCCTLHEPNHFIGVFYLNGERYVVNDLDQSAIYLPQSESFKTRSQDNLRSFITLFTSTSLYYLD